MDDRIVEALVDAGADATINNLWALGWIGGYDKLSMSMSISIRVLAETFGISAEAATELVAYSGDSTNDGPMFGFFKHTAGVSTIVGYLPQFPVPPAWVTSGPGVLASSNSRTRSLEHGFNARLWSRWLNDSSVSGCAHDSDENGIAAPHKHVNQRPRALVLSQSIPRLHEKQEALPIKVPRNAIVGAG
ncbi:HAD family hydrolase [Caballeronia udeis]|uniref:HAD family hydrolase n=1 Tax=Caballeronia udeis TaxID=1232866 RepID=A0A158GPQ6_9BURK|nr:hypothetical protein [Caballeronia udeis]SAL34085.1 HAD family hydrolase [Caballeronia udeis]